jgi:hypothetical protein
LCMRTRMLVSTPDSERVKSKVRTVCSSSCKYGSVRGVAGGGHPYRDGLVTKFG